MDPLLELRVDCQCIQGLDEGHLVGGKGGEFGLHGRANNRDTGS